MTNPIYTGAQKTEVKQNSFKKINSKVFIISYSAPQEALEMKI